jgi:hypothetical protein
MLECEKDEAVRSTISSLPASKRAMLVFDSRACGGLDFDAKQGFGSRRMKLQQEQNFKWSSEANIERYGKLLKGRLTDVERRFVERRLAEELNARQGR